LNASYGFLVLFICYWQILLVCASLSVSLIACLLRGHLAGSATTTTINMKNLPVYTTV